MSSRLALLVATIAVAFPASAAAQAPDERGAFGDAATGRIKQLQGADGCVADRARARQKCARARALDGPGPFLGSRAIAISPDGRNVYVAVSNSDAIAIFERDREDGTLGQPKGPAGCISQSAVDGCAPGAGLDGPSSVAVSPDGQNVYAASVDSDAVASFRRDPSDGSLEQAPGDAGCIAEGGAGGCRSGRGLDAADVVVASADGRNVYVGAFNGSAVATFARDAGTGALVQPPGPAGCISNFPGSGCANGREMIAVEGLAASEDGLSVYAAAAGSNALVVLERDPATGELSQPADASGCITAKEVAGCTLGRELEGANAVEVSPGDETVYVTSLFSNSITSFARTPADGDLAQLEGTSGCVVYLLAVGCGLGQAMSAPEGLAASPDGGSVYATAFRSNAIDVLDRDAGSGALVQKPGKPGCVAVKTTPNCRLGRLLGGASSAAVSGDGEYLYTTAFASDAVGVFKRAQD